MFRFNLCFMGGAHLDPSAEAKLPCLFDRLIDSEPEKKIETLAQKMVSITEYRNAVIRDLRWLLNTPRHLEFEEIYDFPEAEKSVLNYGTRDMTGALAERVPAWDVENEIRRKILEFEPRIIPQTLKVRLIQEHLEPGSLAFEISGEIWALPHPERLLIRTKMDVETGEYVLNA